MTEEEDTTPRTPKPSTGTPASPFDKCEDVKHFMNQTVIFLKELKTLLGDRYPELKEQLKEAFMALKTCKRQKYIATFSSTIEPYLADISASRIFIFTSEHSSEPLYLLEKLDFKLVFACIDEFYQRGDPAKRDQTITSVFHYLQTLYLLSQRAIAQIKEETEIIRQHSIHIKRMMLNLGGEGDISEMMAKLEEEDEDEEEFSIDSALEGIQEVVGSDSIVMKIILEIASEFKSPGMDMNNPIDVCRILFGSDGKSPLTSIITKKLTEKISTMVKDKYTLKEITDDLARIQKRVMEQSKKKGIKGIDYEEALKKGEVFMPAGMMSGDTREHIWVAPT